MNDKVEQVAKVPKFDKRLIGTWKSDRRRTFQHYKAKPGTDPKQLRKLKSLFGKMTIRWGRGKHHSDLEGSLSSAEYEIIGRDSSSVVVRLWDDLLQEYQVRQIHFEEDYYFITVWGGLCEYFRRIS